MTPYKQLFLHDPDNGQYGDCWRTCIACLMDIEPEEVPHFLEDGTEFAEGMANANRWLNARGLFYVTFAFYGELNSLFHCMKAWNPGVYYMLLGTSPRGTSHVVIGYEDTIAHDPHPEGGGIVEPVKDDESGESFYGIEFMTPFGKPLGDSHD